MNHERSLKFRIGLFVIASLATCGALVVHFGDLRKSWQETYPVVVRFEDAAGIYPSAPITLHGLGIGQVRSVKLDDRLSSVVVIADIRSEFKLKTDASLRVVRGLLGESSLVVEPGRAEEVLKPGGRIRGLMASDPMAFVAKLEVRTTEIMDAFLQTTKEFQRAAQNVNHLMETNKGDIQAVVERAATAFHQFSLTMEQTNRLVASANDVLGDPQSQAALKATLSSLPRMMDETQRTIVASRATVEAMNRNLNNLNGVTEPLARRGDQLVTKIDNSLTGLQATLNELAVFSQALNRQDGSLKRLISDPDLYNNLERSSTSLAVLIRNVEPIIRDFREFSDKVARKPELLGVGGAIRPSNGLKDDEIIESAERVVPASRQTNKR